MSLLWQISIKFRHWNILHIRFFFFNLTEILITKVMFVFFMHRLDSKHKTNQFLLSFYYYVGYTSTIGLIILRINLTFHFLTTYLCSWKVTIKVLKFIYCVLIQAQQHLDLNTSAGVLNRLCIPNAMMESVPNRPLDYYTCAFRKSKMSRWAQVHFSERWHRVNVF